MTNDQIKAEFLTLVKEWRAIADATANAAERIKDGTRGGTNAEAERQHAFAYSRRSCAQMLENKVKEIFGSTGSDAAASMPTSS